ncbi:MAG: tRNA (adenosine(37)-N6)-dimethylallyltransferase MiaA [Bacteroidales bacterium]|jgi:tRNA dimethylallyltransferase|nr:tRNA (adenosine(37)-N6)-dimethylallyltransferase MiaA [Bacteroidales bacterium]
MKYNLLVVLGPTASGKTAVAAQWAYRNRGEIISADSRQVYKNMNIGTGKDYDDYLVEGIRIPYHCVDIVEAGKQYSVYEYQKDFLGAWDNICRRGRIPVMCGGSGLYLEAALKGYRLLQTPVNEELRNTLASKTDGELEKLLAGLTLLHNHTDTSTRKRMIRAVEIAMYRQEQTEETSDYPDINPLMVGIRYDREIQRQRITERLQQRLDAGMIDEARELMQKGLTAQQLEYYGLEYKFLVRYLTGQLNYHQMFVQLNTAIHQFAKRQMTWFRRMERNGDRIHWLDGHMPVEEKIRQMENVFYEK